MQCSTITTLVTEQLHKVLVECVRTGKHASTDTIR